MKQESDNLFVYGTLRKGFSLHSYLGRDDVRLIGHGKIPGLLYDLGEFPGAIPNSAGSEIEGEVYELLGGDAQLRDLDQLEEYFPKQPQKSLFIRQRTRVKLRGGRHVSAWTYFLRKLPPEARQIPGGDYAEIRRSS